MLGKIEGKRRRALTEHEMVRQHHWLMDMSLSEFRETVKSRES